MRTSSRPRSTSAFEIVESPIPELVGAYAVIWTTTPWTIPVNQAIAYGPDIEYVCRRVRLRCLAEATGRHRSTRIHRRRRKLLVAAV